MLFGNSFVPELTFSAPSSSLVSALFAAPAPIVGASLALGSVLTLCLLPRLFRVKFKVYSPTESKVIVLITGTSTGIGRDAALELAKKGYVVYATVRKQEDADKLAKDFQLWSTDEGDIDSSRTTTRAERRGKTGELIPVLMDVTDEESMQSVLNDIKAFIEAQEAAERANKEGRAQAVFGGVINNAGAFQQELSECFELSEARKLFEVNLFGMMRLNQLFLPLIRHYKGRIINVGSLAGKAALPLSSVYSASKHAVEGYTDSLRRETLHQGISVSLVEPGVIESAMTCKKYTPGSKLKTREASAGYEDMIKKYVDTAEKQFYAKKPTPKETTTPVIIQALQSTYPKTRYWPVGFKFIPGSAIPFLLMILPERAVDYLFLNL